MPSRGGFEYSFKPQGTEAVLALNEGVPFRDEFGFEPSLHLSGRRRERGRELGDDAGAFTGSVMPRNTYVAPSSPLGRALLYSPTTRPHSPASRASRGGGSPRGTPRDIPRDLALSFEETTADDDGRRRRRRRRAGGPHERGRRRRRARRRRRHADAADHRVSVSSALISCVGREPVNSLASRL